MNYEKQIDRAVDFILQADGLLITAGAGFGVDSGLPDFRGDHGFWKAYPALGAARIGFTEIASPTAFFQTPRLAWGFYGHRLQLYRDTVPHAGFEILRNIGDRLKQGSFVYTSNVDGQFQKAGFDPGRIVECHGSIHFLQCLAACSADIWRGDTLVVEVNENDCLLCSELPRCPHCGGLARPNILMFDDWTYLSARTDAQQIRLAQWLLKVERPVIIEVGAGTAIPSVRQKGDKLRKPLLRINPTEARVAHPQAIGLPMGALAGLQLLKARLTERKES